MPDGVRFDHVLLIGFGGPSRPEEVRPFLEEVARGRGIPIERLEQVFRQYEALGGGSPYNRCAEQLGLKLRAALDSAGIRLPADASVAGLPVFLGMRSWHPFLSEVLGQIKRQGLQRGIGIVLSPHRSEASYDRYLESVEQALPAAGAQELFYEYLPPWYDHPLFIEAQADQARPLWEPLGSEERAGTHVLFSAHSIPIEMARRCRYEEEVRVSSRAVAERLGAPDWSVAFQSRSGPPSQPWLEPETLKAAPALQALGVRSLLVIPIGFLFDHTEVLYDLDVALQGAARSAGLSYRRASTVMDHPKFVAMLAGEVQRCLQPVR